MASSAAAAEEITINWWSAGNQDRKVDWNMLSFISPFSWSNIKLCNWIKLCTDKVIVARITDVVGFLWVSVLLLVDSLADSGLIVEYPISQFKATRMKQEVSNTDGIKRRAD